MSIYSIALFVHVVGAILVFAILTLEGIAIRLLRRVETAREGATPAAVLQLNRVLGPLSGLGVLVPGLYMTATSWGWVPWIAVGLAAWALIAVLGAVNGIRMLAVQRMLSSESGPVSANLQDRIRDPLFVASWSARVGVALAIVFLMTVKPGLPGALVTVAVAVAAGISVSLPGFSRPRSNQPMGAR
jgi:small basic protein